jgi:hypothetical protein
MSNTTGNASPDRGDTRVALAGDWHGSYAWAKDALWHIVQAGR